MFSKTMYKQILITLSLVCFFNVTLLYAEAPSAQVKKHVPGSGQGAGDGSGRSKTVKSQGYVDPLTAEERLANRGKGSGGLGPGRAGKPPKMKKGGGKNITVVTSKETKEMFKMMEALYKRKYDVNFVTKYVSGSELADYVKDRNDIDIVITENLSSVERAKPASFVNSKLRNYKNRVVLFSDIKSANNVKSLKQLDSKAVRKIGVLGTVKDPLYKVVKEALSKEKIWQKTASKLQMTSDIADLIQELKEKKVDIAIAYYSNVNKNKEVSVSYELLGSRYAIPDLEVAIINNDKEPRGVALKFYEFLDSHFADKFFKSYGFTSSWTDK